MKQSDFDPDDSREPQAFEAYPSLAACIENLDWKASGISLSVWGKFLDTLNEALITAADNERVRCAGIVSAARFGKVDQDFRAIGHMIEGGRPVEDLVREASS